MEIGSYVLVESVQLSQSDKWYTLTHLKTDSYGNIVGGTIRYIDKSEALASRHTSVLRREGLIENSVIIGGGLTGKDLVGGVFV